MKVSHTPRLRSHRSSGRESGITILEAAFAVPVFMFFLLALVDGGGAVLQTSQASSAAADGARAAIVIGDLTGAETSGPAHDKIVAAVRARLVGVESKTAVVTVRCLTSTGSTYTCGTEGTLRDRAQVRVDVTWSWSPVSFVGHGMPIDEITGSATMGLIVLPHNFPTPTTTTTTPVPLP